MILYERLYLIVITVWLRSNVVSRTTVRLCIDVEYTSDMLTTNTVARKSVSIHSTHVNIMTIYSDLASGYSSVLRRPYIA